MEFLKQHIRYGKQRSSQNIAKKTLRLGCIEAVQSFCVKRKKTKWQIKITKICYRWSACTEESKQHLATMTLTHSIKLFNKIEVSSMDVNVRQVFVFFKLSLPVYSTENVNVSFHKVGPGYVQLYITSSFGRFVILQTVVPVEPLVQRVIHRFYLPKGLALFSKFTIWGESVMVTECFDLKS